MTIVLGSFVACAFAAASSPLVLRIISGRVVDVPNERSSHEQPTPRGGGLALVAGVGAGLIATQSFTSPILAGFVIAVAFGLVGLIEDIRGIPATQRLALQLSIVAAGLRWVGVEWSEGGWWLLLTASAALIWIVGFTNAFNFMDGINGISAAQLVIAGTVWTISGEILGIAEVSTLGAVTAGASLGFLPWNFPKARFFMGDVGSYFSGSWLAAVTIIGIRAGIPPPVMAAPLLVYGADTSLTILTRIAQGDALLTAHRSHVYQRLILGGWSHVRTTVFFTSMASLVAGSSLLWLLDSRLFDVFGGGGVIVGLGWYLAAPTTQRKRSGRVE